MSLLFLLDTILYLCITLTHGRCLEPMFVLLVHCSLTVGQIKKSNIEKGKNKIEGLIYILKNELGRPSEQIQFSHM